MTQDYSQLITALIGGGIGSLLTIGLQHIISHKQLVFEWNRRSEAFREAWLKGGEQCGANMSQEQQSENDKFVLCITNPNDYTATLYSIELWDEKGEVYPYNADLSSWLEGSLSCAENNVPVKEVVYILPHHTYPLKIDPKDFHQNDKQFAGIRFKSNAVGNYLIRLFDKICGRQCDINRVLREYKIVNPWVNKTPQDRQKKSQHHDDETPEPR